MHYSGRMNVAHRLKEIRERIGWSCSEVDRRAGLSIGHTARIESGRTRISGETLQRLSVALKVSMAWLLSSGNGRTTK